MGSKIARVYWDADSDPRNPGWVVELGDTLEQHALIAGVDAADDDLIADADSWCRGRYEIHIDRSNAPTLDQLFASLKDRAQELHDDLPTFGGEAPARTDGVWSWDATRAIVGECVDDLQIVPRDDLDIPAGLPYDMETEWVPGAKAWKFQHRTGTGWMLRAPNGRGAVCHGGPSFWGDWIDDALVLDDEGERYDADGQRVYNNQIGTIDDAAILEHDGSREDGWCVECGRHVDPVGNAGVIESLPHYQTHPGTDAWDGSCPYCGAPASRVGVKA